MCDRDIAHPRTQHHSRALYLAREQGASKLTNVSPAHDFFFWYFVPAGVWVTRYCLLFYTRRPHFEGAHPMPRWHQPVRQKGREGMPFT